MITVKLLRHELTTIFYSALCVFGYHLCMSLSLTVFYKHLPIRTGRWCIGWHVYKCRIKIQWRHNERDGVSNHHPYDCLLNRLFSRRTRKKISKFRVTGLCEGNSPVTGEYSTQRARNAENVSIWRRHHGMIVGRDCITRFVSCVTCWPTSDLLNQSCAVAVVCSFFARTNHKGQVPFCQGLFEIS